MIRLLLIILLGALCMAPASDTLRGGYTETRDANGDCAYWRLDRTTGASTSPGLSGAVLQVLDTSSIGWKLSTVNDYIYQTARIPTGFDNAADESLVVLVNVSLDGAETANDLIQMEIVVSYFGIHESVLAPKGQTLTRDHDIESANFAGADHGLVFVIDHNLTDNVVDPGDKITIRYRLDSVGGGTDVAAVNFISAEIHMRSCWEARRTNAVSVVE